MRNKLQNSILEDLCVARMEGFESSYIRKYEKIPEREMALKSEEELTGIIKEFINEKEKEEQVVEKINNLVLNLSAEMSFWNTEYYKKGFIDGMNFTKEVSCENNEMQDIGERKDTFFEEYSTELLDFVEDRRHQMLKKRQDYMEVIQKISNIKANNPRVREYLEDNKISVLTEEELKEVWEIVNLTNTLNVIELEEMFKLGIKEYKAL